MSQMSKIICVNGPPCAGKDEFAKQLAEADYKVHIEKFAKPLDAIVAATLGLSIESDEFNRLREDGKGHWLGEYGLPNMTMRQLLITTSENYVKRVFGTNYFGVAAANRVIERISHSRAHSSSPEIIVVTDSGFQDEYDAFKKKVTGLMDNVDVKLVQLYRYGCSFNGDSRGRVVDQGAVYLINHGSKSDLREKVVSIMEEWDG